jgi:HD-GYP domain-containing protein (c-di-GMP phosphodiesterase class II)
MGQNDAKLNLLYQVGKTAMSETELPHLLNQTMLMTQKILNSVTSSILLIDEGTGALIFEAATGKIGEALTKAGTKVKSGVAAWVANSCQSLIVNDVKRDARFDGEIDHCSGFTTKSILCVPLMIGGRCTGVIEVINKRSGEVFNNADLELLTALASTAALAIENARMHQAALNAYLDTVKLLSETIDAKDSYTRGHSQRVSQYALIAGKSLSLTSLELQIIEYAGLLHDVGKVAIDRSILRKPDKLTSEEWAMMINHPRVGATIIADIPILKEVKQLVLYHHERYDGTGYPERLRGNLIPLGARLLAVADSFDTMTTERPYRGAMSFSAALQELQKCSGTQFCPVAVEAFISGFKRCRIESPDMLESGETATLQHTKSIC